MDPEQTFLRVHARLSGMLAQLLTPRLRALMEHMCLVIAVMLLGFLAVMHVNFVGQPGCAELLSNKYVAEAQLLQIKITGYGLWLPQKSNQFADTFLTKQSDSVEMLPITEVNGDALSYLGKSWLYWLGFNTRRNKAGKRILKNDKGRENSDADVRAVSESVTYKPLGRQTDTERTGSEGGHWSYTGSVKGSLGTGVLRLWDRWNSYFATFKERAKQTIRSFLQLLRYAGSELFVASSKDDSHKTIWNDPGSVLVNWLERRSEAFEPVYVYSVEKGYLILPEAAKAQHNVRTVNISISARNLCFGNRWQQLLINSFVGYDTILMNSLLHARGEGYLYNFKTKELYDLNYLHESSGAPNSFEGYVVSKSGVLIMSLFVFFTTTMSVSFTLRETQARMLNFTVQLQYHARHRLPTFRLIFVHVVESLVFVPIMIGILFFLFEFYDDQMLAFMVLTVVWLCELFTMISVRTPMSMQYFPRFFLLYFIIFHIYFFSYEYGFSYLAFSATAAFMQHLVLYFWNHFEVPALQRFLRARALFQQQPGVHITSSAIITSTFHVTRLRPGAVDGMEPNNQIAGLGTLNNGMITGTAHPGTMRFMGGSHVGMRQISTSNLSDGLGRAGASTTASTQAGADHLTAGGRDYPTSTNANSVSSTEMDGRQSMNHLMGVNSSEAPGSQEPHAGVQVAASANPSPLVQPNPLTSFGSILLWILGGPSETLVSFLPIFRDFRDQGSIGTPIQVTPDGPSQRSVHIASGALERVRRRYPHPSQDSQTM